MFQHIKKHIQQLNVADIVSQMVHTKNTGVSWTLFFLLLHLTQQQTVQLQL